MKWEGKDRFILLADPRNRMLNSRVSYLQDKHNIPDENVVEWKDNPSELDKKVIRKIHGNSRLDIVAHGAELAFGARNGKEITVNPTDNDKHENKTPKDVANKLNDMGLSEAGVVKFNTCHSRTEFLEEFASQAKDNGTKIGYISGFEGVAMDGGWGKIRSVGLHIPKRYRDTMNEKKVMEWNKFLSETPISTPAKYSSAVIKGELDVEFPKTRYNKSEAAKWQKQDKKTPKEKIEDKSEKKPELLQEKGVALDVSAVEPESKEKFEDKQYGKLEKEPKKEKKPKEKTDDKSEKEPKKKKRPKEKADGKSESNNDITKELADTAKNLRPESLKKGSANVTSTSTPSPQKAKEGDSPQR